MCARCVCEVCVCEVCVRGVCVCELMSRSRARPPARSEACLMRAGIRTEADAGSRATRGQVSECEGRVGRAQKDCETRVATAQAEAQVRERCG